MAEQEQARSLLPYLQRADELAKHDPLISYYCRMYAVDKGIKIPKAQRTKDTNELLKMVLVTLEKNKKEVVLDEQEDPIKVEGFALNVFAKADKQDRAGRADLNTAKTFYAASIFFDILRQFGELHPDIAEKQKYAVWKAADIRAALRDGRKPMAGPPGGDPSTDEIEAGLAATTQGPTLDRPVSFSDNLPAVPPPPPPTDSFNGFNLSHPPQERLHDEPPFPGMKTGGPPPPGPHSYPSFDSFKHSSAPAMPPPPSFPQHHDPPSAPDAGRPSYPGVSSGPSFQNPMGGNFGHKQDPPSAPEMGKPPYPGMSTGPSFQNPMGGRPQHGYGGPPPGDSTFQPPGPPSSSNNYPSIPGRTSTPPPVLPSVPARVPQPVGGATGQSYFSVQMPHPVPGYQPPPDRVTEAQKLGRFAVSALGFDDVQPAIKYLTQALALLTTPNADIGEIK